jgi:hypothetical protein
VAGWTSSFERERVLEAIQNGSDQAINDALERLFVHMTPETVLMQQLAISRRDARQLDAVDRLERWLKTEQEGRTNTVRQETLRLNRLLRSWFSNVRILTDNTSVHIAVERRETADDTAPSTAEAHISLQEWARTAHQITGPIVATRSGIARRSSVRFKGGPISTDEAHASATGETPARTTRVRSPLESTSVLGLRHSAKPT